jgi:hypothetical protein
MSRIAARNYRSGENGVVTRSRGHTQGVDRQRHRLGSTDWLVQESLTRSASVTNQADSTED